MRMRRRRVERLLARASEACDAGREDAAREALEEIAVLSPLEPRLAELRARVDAVSVAPAVPLPAQDLVVDQKPAIEPPRTDEITRPVVIPAVTELATPSILLDLPLVVEEPAPYATATIEPLAVEKEHRRSGRAVAFAAAALLACGAVGWFAGPPLMRLMSRDTVTRPLQTATSGTATGSTPAAIPTVDEPKPGEPLAPVQVAVDEVAAADTTLDAAAQEPNTTREPAQPAAIETTFTEPAVKAAPPAPARSETSAPSETPAIPEPPPAPVSIVPSQAGIPVERPAPPPERPAQLAAVVEPSAAADAATTRLSSPAPPVNAEPSVPTPTVTPAARETTQAIPRDEEKIRAVLDQYAAAYSRLDASAASAIFPGIDQRALARAFDGLASQKVSLGTCDVRTVTESAMVDCSGSSTWTPKIGGGTRTESRRWQFRLRNESGDWRIVAAKVR